jgi:hypothetical protein
LVVFIAGLGDHAGPMKDTKMSDFSANDLPARVAVLRGTKAALERIERRLDSISNEQRADFRWTLGIMIAWSATLLGVMAHGFHWI